MSASIASELPARPNQSNGRPVDLRIAAFDSLLDGLVAIDEDQAALSHAQAALGAIHRLESAVLTEVARRIARIESTIKPECRRTLKLLDAHLTSSTLARRIAKRHTICEETH